MFIVALLVIKKNVCAFLCEDPSRISFGKMSKVCFLHFTSPSVFEKAVFANLMQEYLFRRKILPQLMVHFQSCVLTELHLSRMSKTLSSLCYDFVINVYIFFKFLDITWIKVCMYECVYIIYMTSILENVCPAVPHF